jgi:hypothetical protein
MVARTGLHCIHMHMAMTPIPQAHKIGIKGSIYGEGRGVKQSSETLVTPVAVARLERRFSSRRIPLSQS